MIWVSIEVWSKGELRFQLIVNGLAYYADIALGLLEF
jgi:hypothetical protein